MSATGDTHLDESTEITNNKCSTVQCPDEQSMIDKKKTIDDVKIPIDLTPKVNDITDGNSQSSIELKIDDTMIDNCDKIAVDTVNVDKTVINCDSKEIITTHEPTIENNNVPKAQDQSSEKKSTSPAPMKPCGWCHDKRSDLNFILPTISGNDLEFCSEVCIVEFRKAVKKGACKQCGNAIRSSIAPNRDFCSIFCWNKAKPKNGKMPKRLQTIQSY